MNNKLKISFVGEIQTEKERTDKLPSRKFFSVKVYNPSDITGKEGNINVFQSFTRDKNGVTTGADWTGALREISKNPQKLLGQTIEGKIVQHQVEPFIIGEREVTSYSCVVLEGQDEITVFKRQGHKIVSSGAVSEPVALQLAEDISLG